MEASLEAFARQSLTKLFNAGERTQAGVRSRRAALTAATLDPYRSTKSLQEKEAFENIVLAASATGAVDVQWDTGYVPKRGRSDGFISRIDLLDIEKLGFFLNCRLTGDKIRQAEKQFSPLFASHPVLSDVIKRWSQLKTVRRFKPDDLDYWLDAAMVVDYTKSQQQNGGISTPIREASAKLFKDNKRIERLAPAVDILLSGNIDAEARPAEEVWKKIGLFREERRREVLSRDYFVEYYGDEVGAHWFERNELRFNQLVQCLATQVVVPFIGAGISVGGGFPTWANHLRQQGRTAGIPADQVEAWLGEGQYEQIIAHIEQQRGREVFAQEIRDVFDKRGRIQDVTRRISELFSDTLITTNYDRLLEQVFETYRATRVQVLNAVTAIELSEPDKTTIIKIHGDIKDPGNCILGKAQYDAAYGEAELDLQRPVPKILARYYRNNSLIFLGCSLRSDRTLQVFQATREAAGDAPFPQHFAIEQAPDLYDDALVARNAELLRLGITAIWYPKDQHHKVEAILRHIQIELSYIKTQMSRAADAKQLSKF